MLDKTATFSVLHLETGDWVAEVDSREEIERFLQDADHHIADLYVYALNGKGRTVGGFPAGDLVQGYLDGRGRDRPEDAVGSVDR